MKIAMYDLEGHLLEVVEGDNVSQIAKILKVPRTSLHMVLSGQNNSAGYKQYREVFQDRPIHKIGNCVDSINGNKYTPINKYYKGQYICNYRNAAVASQRTNVNEGSISLCLSGKKTNAGGFTWKYAE